LPFEKLCANRLRRENFRECC